MATAARLPIAADRAGACVRIIQFVGLDLTDVPFGLHIRLRPDTPGDPLVNIGGVAAPAQGVLFTGVDRSSGVPVSSITIRLDAATMQDQARLPYSGELGDPSVLAYALVGTIGGDVRTLTYGPFVVLPTTFDSDNAPANRPVAYGGGAGDWSTWNVAEVTFSDDVAQVVIDGAPQLAPLIKAATDARDAAQGSAQAAHDTLIATQGALPGAASSAVNLVARAAVSNAHNKVLLANLMPGLIDPAGNPQAADDWRRFAVTVTPGGVVTSNLKFPANSGIVFRRGDASVMSVIPGTGSISGGGDMVPTGFQIPIPADAVIMEACAPIYRFVSDGSNDQLLWPHIVMLEGSVALPGLWSDYLLFDPTKTAREKQWIGRKVGVLADSFWSGRRWYEELQAQLGIELVNFSQGGRTMAGALKDANGNPLTQASVAGLDALIYALHTNSAAANVPVGDPGDAPSAFDASGNATTGTTAFSQAVGALNTLVGWNKDMLLMIGSPIYRPGVDLIPDYQAAMPTLAQMFGGAVVEPDLKCGVNAVNAAERLQDEVHPTETGFQTWYRSAFYDAFLRNSPLN